MSLGKLGQLWHMLTYVPIKHTYTCMAHETLNFFPFWFFYTPIPFPSNYLHRNTSENWDIVMNVSCKYYKVLMQYKFWLLTSCGSCSVPGGHTVQFSHPWFLVLNWLARQRFSTSTSPVSWGPDDSFEEVPGLLAPRRNVGCESTCILQHKNCKNTQIHKNWLMEESSKNHRIILKLAMSSLVTWQNTHFKKHAFPGLTY